MFDVPDAGEEATIREAIAGDGGDDELTDAELARLRPLGRPMRVEQRIGRIDRLGQEHPEIRIVNLHYSDTVEADVYEALRHRINLFQSFVGRLQPSSPACPARSPRSP